MAEYIEREALLDEINIAPVSMSVCMNADELHGMRLAQQIIAKKIETYPAADVVARDCYNRLLAENDELRKERPVVRCGECKYWKKYDNTAGCGYCHAVKFEYGADVYAFHPVREPGFFCADGEKKDGDADV